MSAALDRLENELAVVEARESVVRAWVQRIDPTRLRAAVANAGDGPLGGFTLGVKDIIDTEEGTTERGSPIYRGRQAGADAACVALARRAGAVVAGKTATTEFAVLTPTVTTNPHDPTRTPGGSSSGSAAAVAAGMVRVALGTQTAGSVIRPASFCGVAGFKPTYHAVPVSGVNPFSPSLDTVGYFARTVADLAAVHLALTGMDVTAATPARSGTPRVGLYRSHQWSSADADSAAALDRAAAAWRAVGAEVVELEPIGALQHLADDAQVIMFREGSRSLARERATHEALLSSGLRKLLAIGDTTTVARYAEAQRAAEAGRAAFDAVMAGTGARGGAGSGGIGGFDVLLTPAVIGEAPPMATTGDPVFCRVWTLLGAPALTIPTSTGRHGLPVGVQLIGSRWNDPALLAAGARLEQELARR
ncbi:MAG: amidase [Acidimicrobiales bacterium]